MKKTSKKGGDALMIQREAAHPRLDPRRRHLFNIDPRRYHSFRSNLDPNKVEVPPKFRA